MATPPPPAIDTSPLPRGRVSITPNLLSKQQVQALLNDAKNLHQKGAFVAGGLRRRNDTDTAIHRHKNSRGAADVLMKTATDSTTRICDICGLFDDAKAAACPSDARDDLLDLMADLRELLQLDLGMRLSESMELQYLRYPGGGRNDAKKKERKSGFYGRHFDCSADDESTRRRKVSLLLYLNDGTWDKKKDGGVLRAYLPRQDQQSHTTKKRKRDSDKVDEEGCRIQDIIPRGGTLVLFDSASVEHEVLPTYRERWAVVGWFLTEEAQNARRQSSSTNNLTEGMRKNSKSESASQQRRKKKKRRRRGGS